MVIIVQWVRTSWTKLSRGGPAAAVRNAAPIAFPLPVTHRSVVHEVTMDEKHDFQPDFDLTDLPILQPPGRTLAEVSLSENHDTLRVLPVLRYPIPPRPRRPPAVRLRPGQWLRWQLNYRHSSLTGRGDWQYHQNTLNLAYGPIDPETFLGTPTRLIDERGPLR